MSGFVSFPFKHAPGSRWAYTIPINLPAGVSMTGATVTLVNAAGAPVTGSDLTLSNVTFAQVGTTANISVTADGASLGPYYLQAYFTLDGAVVPHGYRTVELLCALT